LVDALRVFAVGSTSNDIIYQHPKQQHIDQSTTACTNCSISRSSDHPHPDESLQEIAPPPITHDANELGSETITKQEITGLWSGKHSRFTKLLITQDTEHLILLYHKNRHIPQHCMDQRVHTMQDACKLEQLRALTPLQCSASSEAANCTSSPPCVDRVAKLSPLQSPGASFVDLENLKELQAGNLTVDMMSVPGTGAMAAVKT
jgi:hypothetical protein